MHRKYIVTCVGGWLCVTYKTGFGLDDWIYCTLNIHITRDYNTALSLFYTLSSSLLHMH
jgi:hypothetical protein